MARGLRAAPGPVTAGPRTRRWRRWGIVAAVVLAAGLIAWLATGPKFDLSTPEKCLRTFKHEVDERRWTEAEKCLSSRCRSHYREAIADRRLFDFCSPYGYRFAEFKLVPDWRVRSVRAAGDKAVARISTDVPLIRVEDFGFDLQLLREADGLWRVDGPLEDFDRWYEDIIPKPAMGWAAAEERR